MGDLSNFENTISRLRGFDFKAEMVTSISDNTNVLEDLQRTQLQSGKDADGAGAIATKGNDYYSPLTIELKKNNSGVGAIVDYVTNYNTGALQGSLKKEVVGDLVTTTSNVSYFAEREAESSPSTFNLGPDLRLQFAESIVLPTVGAALLDKTGLVITNK